MIGYIIGGILILCFIVVVMCLFIHSGRISEQEERINRALGKPYNY